MTRLRTDQACLEAQLQAQVAQRLTAELAVTCPDCGVEPGRACRDSFDRAVKSHLAREVASMKRDTVPCPGPDVYRDEGAMARVEGALQRNLRTEIDAVWIDAPEPSAAPVENCTGCSKPLRSGVKLFRRHHAGRIFAPFCGDCAAELDRDDSYVSAKALDQRIAESKSDDATECAWSTPTSDGEGWRRG